MTVKELKALGTKELIEELKRTAFSVCKSNGTATHTNYLDKVEKEITRRLEA